MSDELEGRTVEVSDRLIGFYAAMTQDFNPIHVDPEYAATTAMGGVIAHGTLSLNLIWESIEASAPEGMGYEMDVHFLRPVRIGDRLTSGGRRKEDGSYDVWVNNQADEPVIAGTASLPGVPPAQADEGCAR